MVDFVKLFVDGGSFTVTLVGILVYWQLTREKRLSERLDKVQDEQVKTSHEVIAKNSEALMCVRDAMNRLVTNCELKGKG
jgi:hypothetical protein